MGAAELIGKMIEVAQDRQAASALAISQPAWRGSGKA
jgi:hypothetical protein